MSFLIVPSTMFTVSHSQEHVKEQYGFSSLYFSILILFSKNWSLSEYFGVLGIQMIRYAGSYKKCVVMLTWQHFDNVIHFI